MALEIEKKWLLKSIPDIKFDDQLDITQHYCPTGRYRMTYSHKAQETSFHKCVKTFITEGVNEEVEEKISAADFWAQIDNAERSIAKMRLVKKVGKLKYEVDVFKDLTIVIAEVEVADIKKLSSVKPPEWLEKSILMDVTGYKQFNNYNLAHTV